MLSTNYYHHLLLLSPKCARARQEKDVRIILGNFDEKWALQLFCEAFTERMTGRKYQWILTGISEDKLWQSFESNHNRSRCSKEELLIAMDGYIITDITPVSSSQRRTVSGMVSACVDLYFSMSSLADLSFVFRVQHQEPSTNSTYIYIFRVFLNQLSTSSITLLCLSHHRMSADLL